MCGIVGVLNFDSRTVDAAQIKQMCDVLAHRGPDGEGQWISPNRNIGLGHRRLSIIDLTEKGAQPMHYGDGRYTITYNGEIYNYTELRHKLEQRNYKFRSATDTEVLLALYDYKQEAMLEDLDGMFSFAIWDQNTQELFCARDRFGEKPFFYCFYKNSFVFASEMKALWAYGVPKTINEDKRKLYIDRAVIRTASTVTDSFFENISILDAAHSLRIASNGDLSLSKYWSLDHVCENRSISFSSAVREFRSLLSESVMRRLRSDVTVGSSLSGGLDSSTIVSLIDEVKGGEIEQKSFTARFEEFDKDEGSYVRALTAVKPCIQVYDTYPEHNDLLDLLRDAAYFHEEPVGSSSVLAQWEVYRKAKSESVTVLLDGQGADEYLSGYIPIYNIYLKQLFYENRLLYRKEYKAFVGKHDPAFHAAPETYDDSARALIRYAWLKFLGKPMESNPPEYRTLKQHIKLLTTQTTLKELLRYADRSSMAHSREVRLPFLSHKLVEFVHSLPDKYLLHEGWTKYILRTAMEKTIPAQICWRVDKVGYEPPQQRWMDNSDIQDIIFQQKQKYGLTDVKNISYTNSIEWRMLADYFL